MPCEDLVKEVPNTRAMSRSQIRPAPPLVTLRAEQPGTLLGDAEESSGP